MNKENHKNPPRMSNRPPQPAVGESVSCLGPDLPTDVAQLSLETTFDELPLLFSTPKIRRLSMVPSPIDRNPLGRFFRRICGRVGSHKSDTISAPASTGQNQDRGWRRAAAVRRIALVILITLQTLAASWSLTNTFPYPWLEGFGNRHNRNVRRLILLDLFWILDRSSRFLDAPGDASKNSPLPIYAPSKRIIDRFSPAPQCSCPYATKMSLAFLPGWKQAIARWRPLQNCASLISMS